MECDYCGGIELRFAWKREFELRLHGWCGVHEYWVCMKCGRGYFLVSEV